jgi:hypothetical protein
MADVIADERRHDYQTRDEVDRHLSTLSTERIAADLLRDGGWYTGSPTRDRSTAEAHEKARLVAEIQDLLERFGHETHARAWALELVELVSNLDQIAREKGDS